MKFAQLVVGPAGCGKSSYCHIIQEHCAASQRSCKIINLDPAAEQFEYNCYLDIRDLITVNDVMEELHYGPNGGLVFAMEYVLQNSDWLEPYWNELSDDDFILFDCPGQIELYTHMTIIKSLLNTLENEDFKLCAVYCMDVSFIADPSKFVSGSLAALSAMIQLEVPHVNVLTKCDLVKEDSEISEFLTKGPEEILHLVMNASGVRKSNDSLTVALCSLLDEYSLVSWLPLNREDEESVNMVMVAVDHILQWDDNTEPRANFDLELDS